MKLTATREVASLHFADFHSLKDVDVLAQVTGGLVIPASISIGGVCERPPLEGPAVAPRLEFFQSGSKTIQRVTIEQTPFKIGRCETSDLRIDSAQVSREHAQIYKRGSIWAVRDLGSTNGTQVNGKSIRESFLADGDILGIAETEVTFVASSVTPFQRMATQPMRPRESSKPPAPLPAELACLRALTEATLWQAIPLQLDKVVSLDSGENEACFPHCPQTHLSDFEGHPNHSLLKYYREISRLRAVEMARANGTATRILLAADRSELESPQQLVFSFESLQDQLLLDGTLGVAVSVSNVLDSALLDGVHRELRQANLLLGVIDFQGSNSHVLELAANPPDYLLLSEKMLEGITVRDQPLRRLELVLAACQQLGIKAVLPLCGCPTTRARCEELGYQFEIKGAPPEKNLRRPKEAALAC